MNLAEKNPQEKGVRRLLQNTRDLEAGEARTTLAAQVGELRRAGLHRHWQMI